MSDDIRSILERLSLVEGRTVPVSPKGNMTKQQKGVPQLPALFKPKSASPALGSKTDPAHPMDGYMVGEGSLAEAMQEVEEDMLSKVRKDLNVYLDRLEDKMAGDDGRREKQTPELDKLADKDTRDRDLMQKAVDAVNKGEVEESPAQIIALEDGTLFEIYECGPEEYEIRHGGKSLPTRFPNIDHAKMAVDIFKSRKQQQQQQEPEQDLSQDYIEEK